MSKILPLVADLIRVKMYKHSGEWAYHNRVLPPENAEPGRFDINRTPYFIEPAEALANPNFDIVGVMCGTQQAKSELCNNFIGHRMDARAQPAIFVFPTQKLAESFSQTRFSKMLQTCKSLAQKHQKGKSDKITLKIINGAPLLFAYATSASQLCSHACATACVDELDRMPDDVEGEGAPLELILARLATYPNSKALVTSTPTLAQISPIFFLFKEGTAGKCHVSCPHCNEWILPCFDIFRWDDDDYEKVSRAWLECPKCKGEIGEEYKSHISDIKNIKYWRVEKDGTLVDWRKTNNKTATFWMSGMLSPWRNFLYCATRWLKAVGSGSEKRKQAVMNTVFGEPYEGKGEAPPSDAVKECRLSYTLGQLKRAFSDVIFMTVDVQKDGLYYVIRGWNTRSKSALIDRGFIFGDTEDAEVWKKCYNLSRKKWGKYPVNYTFIDAGYRTAYVYGFCKKYGSNYIPVIGREKQRAPILSSDVEIDMKGKRFRYGLKLFTIDDGYFKEMLYSRIREATHWHVPYNIDDEYCKQVTSESLYTDGFRKKWIKKYKHNHYLDCEKMQLFASALLHIDLAGEDNELNYKGLTEEEQNEIIESNEDKVDKLVKMGSIISTVAGGVEKSEEEIKKELLEKLSAMHKAKEQKEQDKEAIKSFESKPKEENVISILSNKDNIGVNVWGD